MNISFTIESVLYIQRKLQSYGFAKSKICNINVDTHNMKFAFFFY